MSQPPYGPPPTVEQGYYGHHAPPPPKKKRTGLKIFLGIVGALILIGGCAALFSGGPDETPTGAADKPKTQAKAPGGDKKDKEAEAEPETPGIGAVVKDGKFAFKVTKLSKASRVGSEFLNKDAQGVFWLVYVTVKNVGDEPQSFFGDAQKVFDGKGREYSASSEAALYLQNSKSLYEEINPGNSVRGVVLFDLPKNVKPAKIELHDSLFSGGITVGLQ